MLQVVDLKLGYKGIPAIQGVSFAVKAGEVVAIVGANGAGKSTLIRGISGLLPAMDGSIVFQGTTISNWPAHRIVGQGIAHVPEGRLTFARMTVEQNLALGAFTVPNKAKQEKLYAEVYDMFPRLAERRQQIAGTLSGGEQQMLAIARGLMSDPRLILLDEPSLGLAPKLVSQIFGLIATIKQHGKTILLVEQNVHEALELADRAYVLQTGRMVTEGSGRELLGSELVRKAYLGI
ncbi:ABC transporter ATP-binding protein [Acetonema longum]|uniref:ABC transporter-like protein n=1 Tax=Acetonema longum DSM 6540 TaxID=1009370 RepID=F7NHT5_9FIRM|nr:ABC transporter ATP-binding protein [Acetonema longum]EGO64460.1 ABC transporter-like protein [Acetonema longum DSM 6540]